MSIAMSQKGAWDYNADSLQPNKETVNGQSLLLHKQGASSQT